MKHNELSQLLDSRPLVLDGAMGTMIQKEGFGEAEYRGTCFASYDMKLAGCNDLLCITQPEAIRAIHEAYLRAGADIISTNSFNANAVSMADYGLQREPGLIKEINREAARLARAAVEAAPLRAWGGKGLVAGSIGPTNRTASMSPEVSDPAFRNVTYDDLFNAYVEQIEGLAEGGVDLLLFETVFDTLNLKAGLDAARHVKERTGCDIPVMISATVSDKAGRTLSGQTLKAFITSVEDYDNVISIGLNCSFGPADIVPYVREVGENTRHYVSSHPNAGLPNALGEYDETPEKFAYHLGGMLREGLLNIAGGCCGTTPDHIAALVKELPHAVVRKAPAKRKSLRVAGLENLEVTPENNFVNVGERCNVAGSRKFLRLINEKKYEEAMEIALRQVQDGAMMIDVNMDDAMLDAHAEMVHFLRHMASDPEIARVPVMVDSSQWSVVEDALKNLQGKSIVNSISLKEGEEPFLRKARRIKELGAAVIVMAFDEEGQADTFSRKIEISRRAYHLLVDKCGFNSDDIIFDVNIMAVATGIPEHDLYGIDFIKAVRWIKENLPGARTSGGVSNLSFAFRGKNALREAMHAVFLYHAIAAGLDMGIVNPSSAVTYEDIEPGLRTLLEDVILARRPGASDDLAAYATSETATAAKKSDEPVRDLSIPVDERLTKALVKGDAHFLTEDLDEAMALHGEAVKVIEGPLMAGMNKVGELFGAGKMFLPQVVKTARTMKMAVDHLKPFMEAASAGKKTAKAGKVVFATVKGDVHDIGKNICSIVLACNNYEVIDLGVMVPAEKIIETVREERPDLVCLSGLITPSLPEMVNVARMMEAAGFDTPLLVGGATTSRVHTALKIAPVYHAPVVHVTDAAQNPLVAARLMNPATQDEFVAKLDEDYGRLRAGYTKSASLLPLAEARRKGRATRVEGEVAVPASGVGKCVITPLNLKEIMPFINWKMLFHAWRLAGRYLERFPYDLCEGCIAGWRATLQEDEKEKAEEALKLYRDALDVLDSLMTEGEFDGKAAVVFHRVNSDGDNLVVRGERETVVPMLRQQGAASRCLSLADLFLAEGDDYAGFFVVTAGRRQAERAAEAKARGDEYNALLRQSVADRIAEAASEWMHMNVRRRLWGYAPDEEADVAAMLEGRYTGIRPAMGYPMLPDQLLNHTMGELLPLAELGVSLTENGAMSPSATVSGIYVARPESCYFMIGEIGDDQVRDYASRRGLSEERVKEILRIIK